MLSKNKVGGNLILPTDSSLPLLMDGIDVGSPSFFITLMIDSVFPIQNFYEIFTCIWCMSPSRGNILLHNSEVTILMFENIRIL